MRNRPLELTLDLLRQNEADDPFAFRFQEQAYLRLLPDGTVRRSTFPWNEELLKDLHNLEQDQPDPNSLQRLGDVLRRFLEGLSWKGDEERLLQALEEKREVQLTLQAAAAEMFALPWDLLTLPATGKPFGMQARCTVRYRWPEQRPRKAQPAATEGRILFAWSAARRTVPFLEHEEALNAACLRGDFPFDPRRDVLPHLSVPSLVTELKRAREAGTPVTVLHLLCHGRQTASGLYGLVWNGASPEQAEDLVDPGRLRDLLEPYADSLRMVVLCACQGSRDLPGRHLGSVARELHRAGVPVVVASRLPLSWEGSLELTRVLYTRLLGVPESPHAALEEPCSLEAALGAARQKLRESGQMDWASLQLYVRAEVGTDIRPLPIRPYRGLLAFEPKHRRFFFGRAPLEQQLFERVRQASEGRGPRFQLVAGASGSGKSSLVLAGLVPRLQEDTRHGWDVAVMQPGEAGAHRTSALSPGPSRFSTLGRLRELLSGLYSAGSASTEQAASMEQVLAEARSLRAARPEKRLLLVVDQFEEVFTQVPTAEEREAFVQVLWRLTQQAELQIVVLATLRMDAFERCGDLRLEEGLWLDTLTFSDKHRLFVEQLHGQNLEEVIQRPAHVTGLEFEPGLVKALIRDVEHEPGALPLLEHALDMLWELREGGRLTQDAYARIDGAVGAIARRGDQLYGELSEDERRQARRLLVALVDFRDAAGPNTRRRAWLEDVYPRSEKNRNAFSSVVAKLVSRRLVVTGVDQSSDGQRDETWLQIAHEALIRRWETLRRWVEEDRERELRVRELEEWAKSWEEHRNDEEHGEPYLLRGNRLGYALSIRDKHGDELSERSRLLLEESEAAEKEHQEDEARRQRREREQLEVAKDTARILQAAHLRSVDPMLAVLVLREVAGYEKHWSWTKTAFDVLQQPCARAVLRGHEGALPSAAFSPDGQKVVTASWEGTARIWSTDGRLLAELKGHRDAVNSAVFSPDGQWVVTASDDDTARVWSTNGTLLAELKGHTQRVNSADFSPDGQRVVTASKDQTARIWRLDGVQLAELRGHGRGLLSATFSPDGRQVLTVSKDGIARVWKGDGTLETELKSPGLEMMSAAFNRDGRQIVTGTWQGSAQVWSTEGKLLSELQRHSGTVWSASFSPDGLQVVTASQDGTARVWSSTGGLVAELRGHSDVVYEASFSPDGQWVVTASKDRTARVWHSNGTLVAELKGHDNRVMSASFSPNGKWVVTASSDRTARLWSMDGAPVTQPKHRLITELKGHEVSMAAFTHRGDQVATISRDGTSHLWSPNGAMVAELKSHQGDVVSLVPRPDGQRVVSTSRDGTVRVWNGAGSLLAELKRPDLSELPQARTDEERLRTSIQWTQRQLSSTALSPDGQRVATAFNDGTTWLWRVDGTLVAELKGHTERVSSVAFSPDGQRVVTASKDGTARIWSTNGALIATLKCSADQTPPEILVPSLLNPERMLRHDTTHVYSPSGVFIAELKGEADTVWSAAFSPDGQRVVTASEDGIARVWSAEGALEVELKGHQATVTSAIFSPDGQRIVTTSWDRTARVWSVDGRLRAELAGHRSGVVSASFSPDGQQVVTASDDATARVWRTDGPLVAELKGHKNEVRSATFSPDGQRVVTTSLDRTARVWCVGARALRELLEDASSASLSISDRQQYLGEDPEEALAHSERSVGVSPPPTSPHR